MLSSDYIIQINIWILIDSLRDVTERVVKGSGSHILSLFEAFKVFDGAPSSYRHEEGWTQTYCEFKTVRESGLKSFDHSEQIKMEHDRVACMRTGRAAHLGSWFRALTLVFIRTFVIKNTLSICLSIRPKIWQCEQVNQRFENPYDKTSETEKVYIAWLYCFSEKCITQDATCTNT